MAVKVSDRFYDACPRKIEFSTGEGRTNRYRHRKESSEVFVAHVTDHRASAKKEVTGWSPFIFEGDMRRAEKCIGADMLPLDIDGGATVRDAVAALRFSSYAAVVVSSWSHHPEKPKFRIIAPLAKPFRVADYASVKEAGDSWKRLCLAFAAELGLTADPNAMLLSQFFYDPRHSPGTEPVVRFVEGRALDAEKLLAKARLHASEAGADSADARERASVGRGEGVTPNPFKRDGEVDVDAVRSAMEAIKNDKRFDERNDWLSVCGALHHATGGSSEGLEIWLEWCDLWDGGKSDAALNKRDWHSMRDGRADGATAATLIRLAKRDGWPAYKWGIEEPIDFKDERKRERLQTALTVGSSAQLPADKGDEVAPNALSIEELNFTGEGGDLYNGKVFAKLFSGALLFIHETGDVLRFDAKGGWLAAAPGTAERAAKAVVDFLKSAASDGATMRHVTRLCDVRAQRAMIEMARSEDGMTRRLSEFDGDPMMLGVANGVVDLRTGRLFPVSPKLLVSKRCNVAFDPRADCPRFDQFMCEVQPDGEVRAFLQRFAGYCLTGRVDEQVFAFFYGHGANGKSTFIELLAWILRDYASRIATELLMQHQRSPQGPSPDVLLLRGKRLVFVNETEEGARLASSRVKEMTGGDTLSARAPYGRDFVSFAPSHKLVIVGNHQPEISDTSLGMWRRVVLTPWKEMIPEGKRDPQLLRKLKEEGAGILNWALDGLRAMQEDGLRIPKVITAATDSYRDDQDLIRGWIDENCRIGRGLFAKRSDLYEDYEGWCKRNGLHPMGQPRFSRRLRERGFSLEKDNRTVRGLSLRHDGARDDERFKERR